jgi:hypothetical protein
LQNQNYSFVVRLWLENSEGDRNTAIWRGSIEQVGSDGRIYFSDLDGITRIIQTQVGMPASPSRIKWQLWSTLRNRIEKSWKHLFG